MEKRSEATAARSSPFRRYEVVHEHEVAPERLAALEHAQRPVLPDLRVEFEDDDRVSGR